jgi:hypothetical protein
MGEKQKRRQYSNNRLLGVVVDSIGAVGAVGAQTRVTLLFSQTL